MLRLITIIIKICTCCNQTGLLPASFSILSLTAFKSFHACDAVRCSLLNISYISSTPSLTVTFSPPLF
nr:MAG TPA: hypothetical protein [Caudoviricetes sp.]